MLVQLLAGGVAWIAALALLAALLQWSGAAPSTVDPGRAGVSALARALNEVRPHRANGAYAWTVTAATSALGELVVHVDAVNTHEARQIAEQLIAGAASHYDEVLIYVEPANPGAGSTIHRVEWTPRRGYRESAF